MRTYDPADSIRYVHLAQDPASRATPPPVHDECRRLPADYANLSPRARIGALRTAGARPALVLLAGGLPDAAEAASATPALRLAR